MPETVIIFLSRQFHSIISPSQAPVQRIGSRNIVKRLQALELWPGDSPYHERQKYAAARTSPLGTGSTPRLFDFDTLVSRPRSAPPTGSAVLGPLGIACVVAALCLVCTEVLHVRCSWVSCVMRCRFWLDRKCFSRILSGIVLGNTPGK